MIFQRVNKVMYIIGAGSVGGHVVKNLFIKLYV